MSVARADAEVVCNHNGRVQVKVKEPALRMKSGGTLTVDMVKDQPIKGCMPPPGVPPCKKALAPMCGLSPGAKSDGQTPLLESAVGLTDGPGIWSIRGSVSTIRPGGGLPPAPAAVPGSKPAEASISRSAPARGTKAGPGLRISIKLDTALLPRPALDPFPRALAVSLVVVQGDCWFAVPLWDPLAVPLSGAAVEIDTGLDPAKPAVAVATTQPLSNGVWAFEPKGARPPFVLHPPSPATDIVGKNPNWKPTLKAIAAAAGVEARAVARANGFDPAKADTFTGWAVVRVPVELTVAGGAAEVVLEPLYPRLLTVRVEADRLARRFAELQSLYGPQTPGRLRVAMLCEHAYLGFGSKLEGTFFTVPDPNRLIPIGKHASRTEDRELFRVLLDAHDEFRSTAVPSLGAARTVASALAAADGSDTVAPEFTRFENTSPRSLRWCRLPGTPRTTEDLADYLESAVRHEAATVVTLALQQVFAVVRVADELDATGRVPKTPLLSDADRKWWSDWFGQYADRVLLADRNRGDNADTGDVRVWDTVVGLLGWLGKMPRYLVTRSLCKRWEEPLKDRVSAAIRPMVWFESSVGIEIVGRQSRFERLLQPIKTIRIADAAETAKSLKWLKGVGAEATLGEVFERVKTFAHLKGFIGASGEIDVRNPGRRLPIVGAALIGLLMVRVVKEQTADPAALPAPSAFPSWWKDAAEFAQLGAVGMEAFLKREARDVVRILGPAAGANAAAGFAVAARGFELVRKPISLFTAVLDIVSAVDEVKNGNQNRAAAFAASGLVGVGLVFWWASAPFLPVVLATLGLVLLIEVFRRTPIQDEWAKVLVRTEFGEDGAKALKIAPPALANRSDDCKAYAAWRREYFRDGRQDPAVDLKQFGILDAKSGCVAQLGWVQDARSQGMNPYPAACLWVAPRPARRAIRAEADLTAIVGAQATLDVQIVLADLNPNGDMRVRVRVGPVGANGRPTPLTPRTALGWMERSATTPFAATAADQDGNTVLFVAFPAVPVPLDLGELHVPREGRLLLVLAEHEASVIGARKAGQVLAQGTSTVAKVRLKVHLGDDATGQPLAPEEGWVLDPVTVRPMQTEAKSLGFQVEPHG